MQDRVDCAEFLIDRYPPLVNLADVNGDNVSKLSVFDNEFEVMLILLDYLQPLHAACGGGSSGCVRLLLHKGQAQTTAVNKLGMSPAHLGESWQAEGYQSPVGNFQHTL